jgi:spore coat polysaccharide biosynthesis protein SpsF (cytidylyltransferase family)
MTGIIIQARTGSTRLPQKMIIPFFEEKGIFETLLIRLKKAYSKTPIILATTNNPADDILEKIGLQYNIDVYRGSEDNVLDRFIKASEAFNLAGIIRVCADNPFLDMIALSHLITNFNKTDVDYWCYALSDKTPTIKTHYGFWTEGVKLDSLKQIAFQNNEKIFQEHVTNYIYSNPDEFSIHFEKIEPSIENAKNIRLTIDTLEDFHICQKIYTELMKYNIPFEASHIASFIKTNQEYLTLMNNEINKNIK